MDDTIGRSARGGNWNLQMCGGKRQFRSLFVGDDTWHDFTAVGAGNTKSRVGGWNHTGAFGRRSGISTVYSDNNAQSGADIHFVGSAFDYEKGS